MNKATLNIIFLVALLQLTSCAIPKLEVKKGREGVPSQYTNAKTDSTKNVGKIQWRTYFTDKVLIGLIDTALVNNQELEIAKQEVLMALNESSARKGEYLPFLGFGSNAGVEKVGRYTRFGASEAGNDIKPGVKTPEFLPDFMLGTYASWEVDIWNKLHNRQKAALNRYLASNEGRNFLITNLVAEIANTYYELLSLDYQLSILTQNIQIQTEALQIVRTEKEAARVTELAVKRFEAQVLSTRSMQFATEQQITEAENKLKRLTGVYNLNIDHNADGFLKLKVDSVFVGMPIQLLENRPDIRQAKLELIAAKLEVDAAKANFYPSLRLGAGIGINAYKPSLLFTAPESILLQVVGELTAPLINKRAIKATYSNANARQIQAIYNFQRAVLNAYLEVENQHSMQRNMSKRYILKEGQVQALNQSVTISNNLFRSARADYMEVLLTQRDAQEARFELVDTRLKQIQANILIYKALGGGWQ